MDTAALVASVAIWITGLYLSQRHLQHAAQRLPSEWLAHEQIGPLYREFRLPDARENAAWIIKIIPAFIATFGGFAALEALDVLLLVQVIACLTFAGLNTSWSVDAQRRSVTAFAAESGLPALARTRRGTLAYVGTTFLSSLGFAGTACFAARLVFG